MIDVPEGVTKIANGTFDGCHNLNTIKLRTVLRISEIMHLRIAIISKRW